jgi:photosystem II stability/assembly factor-like uncharacterized protein
VSSYGQTLYWEQTKTSPPHFSGSLLPYGNSLFLGSDSGLFHSPDSGDSWESVQGILGQTGIVMIYRHESVLLAEIVTPFRTDSYTLYESSDGGTEWDSVGYLSAGQYYLWSSNAVMVQGSALENGVYISTDSGHTWNCVSCAYNPELPVTAVLSDSLVVMLTFMPGSRHLARSTDLGYTWKNLDMFDSSMYPVAAVGNTIFASVGADLYRSRDQGENWEKILDSVRFKIFQKDTIYALTSKERLNISTDRGSSWSQTTNVGLPSLDFSEWVASDGRMYARFASGELYRTTLPLRSGVSAANDHAATNRIVCSPNPFDERTVLTFENCSHGVMYMDVMNSLGASVLRETIPDVNGYQQYSADLSSLPAGAYYIRLVCPADGWSATASVIKTGAAQAPWKLDLHDLVK